MSHFILQIDTSAALNKPHNCHFQDHNRLPSLCQPCHLVRTHAQIELATASICADFSTCSIMFTEKTMFLAAVKFSGLLLAYASAALQDDKEVALAACAADGLALEFASPRLRRDRDVVLAACQSDG